MNQRQSKLNPRKSAENQILKADPMLLRLNILFLVLALYLLTGWMAAHRKVARVANFVPPPTTYQLQKMGGPGTHVLVIRPNNHYFQ